MDAHVEDHMPNMQQEKGSQPVVTKIQKHHVTVAE